METTDTQTRDIILRLKRVKAARGLSCGRICAMVAEAGGSVSLSTVKRVFADVGGLGVRPRPQYDFDALYAKYPRAAAYLKADGMALAEHDVKAAAGRKARERIINGEDGSEALADAEAEWAAYCAEHIWD